MYPKLFQITIVLFLVIVSIAAVAMIVTALLSMFSSPMLARDEGIVMAVGGVSDKQLAYMIVAASLLIAGIYLFFRRRRFRR
jgi:hypothetical protein